MVMKRMILGAAAILALSIAGRADGRAASGSHSFSMRPAAASVGGMWLAAARADGASALSVPAGVGTESGAGVSAPEGRAETLLRRVSDGFRSMKRYGVGFEVATEGYRASGSYVVEGEAYCLELGDAEVFCDGKVRYEVDHDRREVTIVDVDRTSRNLLNNPVRAFDFIGSDYSCELLWERGGQAAVLLTPTADREAPAGAITLLVDVATMRPVSLSYDYEGERVDIAIRSVGEPDAPLRRFDRKACGGYEFIDFR